MDDAQAVTAYLDSLPGVGRERLETIRAGVHSCSPGLGEKISYGVLTFTVDGRTAFHAAGYAAHVALYPVPDDQELADRMKPYLSGASTLRFPHTQDLPLELIEDIALSHLGRARR